MTITTFQTSTTYIIPFDGALLLADSMNKRVIPVQQKTLRHFHINCDGTSDYASSDVDEDSVPSLPQIANSSFRRRYLLMDISRDMVSRRTCSASRRRSTFRVPDNLQ